MAKRKSTAHAATWGAVHMLAQDRAIEHRAQEQQRKKILQSLGPAVEMARDLMGQVRVYSIEPGRVLVDLDTFRMLFPHASGELFNGDVHYTATVRGITVTSIDLNLPGGGEPHD